MTFPNHLPADRRYIHGSWPITRHRFMSNTEQRVLHATAKVGQELRLTYANRTPEVIQQYFDHYNQSYGTQYAFEIPREVFVGWSESRNLLGQQLLWQYKQAPRITSQRGTFGTLEVTLIAATTGGLLPDTVINVDSNPVRSFTPASSTYDVSHPAWSDFMNNYAIWFDPLLGDHDFSVTLDFPVTGTYTFHVSSDNSSLWGINGGLGYETSPTSYLTYGTWNLTVSSGSNTISATAINFSASNNTFDANPGGWAMQILKPDGTELWNSRMRVVGTGTATLVSSGLHCIENTGLPVGKAPGSGSGRFPAYHPSNRNITLSDWNTKRFDGSLSRQAVTMTLPSTAVDNDGKLSLTFANRVDAVAEEILTHYDAYTSSLNSFQLSPEILEDWNSPFRFSWTNSQWIYETAPQVTSTHIGTSTTNVRLLRIGQDPVNAP